MCIHPCILRAHKRTRIYLHRIHPCSYALAHPQMHANARAHTHTHRGARWRPTECGTLDLNHTLARHCFPVDGSQHHVCCTDIPLPDETVSESENDRENARE